MHNRILWADQAKALAISAMVLCHYGLSNPDWVKFICIWHMPIFFFISGFFDKAKPFCNDLLKKNFKSLIVPYFFFSILAFTTCWISPYLHPELYYNDGIGKTYLKALVGMFLMEDRTRTYAFMPSGPLWFLVALFEVRIIFSIMLRNIKSFCYIFSTIILTIVFCIVFNERIMFFSLDAAIMALPIYTFGYITKRFSFIEKTSNRWHSALLFFIGIVYMFAIGMKNGNISMDGANYGNSPFMFYINGIIGALTFIYLFKALNIHWNWLTIVGSSTLTMLGTHGYIGIAGKTIGVVLLNIDVTNTPLWFVLPLTIIGIIWGVLCHKFIMNKIPWALGK